MYPIKMDTSSFSFYPAFFFKQWCMRSMNIDCDVQTIVKKLMIHIFAPQTFIPPSVFVVRENLDNNEFVDQGVVFRLDKCTRMITVHDEFFGHNSSFHSIFHFIITLVINL